MAHERASDFMYDQIEHQAAGQAAGINAALGEVKGDAEFDFCNGCPRLGNHTNDEARNVQALVGWHLSMGGTFNGALVSMQLVFDDDTRSDKMLLNAYGGNMLTGHMVEHAKEQAAQRTQECTEPKKVPKILGPLGIKTCPAVKKFPKELDF